MSNSTLDRDETSVINITNVGGDKPWHIDLDNVGIIKSGRAALAVPTRDFETREEAISSAEKIKDTIGIDSIKIDGEYDDIDSGLTSETTSLRDPSVTYEDNTSSSTTDQQFDDFSNKEASNSSAFDAAMNDVAIAREDSSATSAREDSILAGGATGSSFDSQNDQGNLGNTTVADDIRVTNIDGTDVNDTYTQDSTTSSYAPETLGARDDALLADSETSTLGDGAYNENDTSSNDVDNEYSTGSETNTYDSADSLNSDYDVNSTASNTYSDTSAPEGTYALDEPTSEDVYPSDDSPRTYTGETDDISSDNSMTTGENVEVESIYSVNDTSSTIEYPDTTSGDFRDQDDIILNNDQDDARTVYDSDTESTGSRRG